MSAGAQAGLSLNEHSMINLLSLLLLSFFSIVVSPSLGPALSHSKTTQEIGMWYNLLLSWPVFAVCFWVNVSLPCSFPLDPLSNCIVKLGPRHIEAGSDAVAPFVRLSDAYAYLLTCALTRQIPPSALTRLDANQILPLHPLPCLAP
jgi:hypothetical protein